MKKSIKILRPEALNYMFTPKINYVWVLNLILFATVVFLGIEQAGKGAQISNLESKIESSFIQKRALSEEVFNLSSDTKIAQQSEELGFAKPTDIYYFKTEDLFAQR